MVFDLSKDLAIHSVHKLAADVQSQAASLCGVSIGALPETLKYMGKLFCMKPASPIYREALLVEGCIHCF